MLRRAQVSSQEPLQQQATDSSRHIAAAPARQVYGDAIGIPTIPGMSRAWRWHTGDRKYGHGAILAKLPLPIMPLTVMAPCSLDITCYPPQPTPVPQVVGARWQQIESVRLIFRSDRMAHHNKQGRTFQGKETNIHAEQEGTASDIVEGQSVWTQGRR